MWLKTFFPRVAAVCVCLLLLTSIRISFAGEPENVFRPIEDKAKMMAPYLQYLRDPKGTLKIGDMANEIHNFRPVSEPTNLGYTKIVYWIRFTIDLKFYNEPEWFLIKEFYREFVTLYYPSANGFTAVSIDDALPLRSRNLKLRDYIFRIPSAGPGPVTYYMRIDPRGNATDLDFSWAGVNGALENIAKKDFWLNLFFGCLLAMWLYNAFLYSYVRDKAYLYYIYYLGCFIGIFLDATGTIALFFDVPPFLIGLFPMCTYGALHGASLFARRFLNLPSTMPKVDQYLRYFQWVLLLAACSTFILPISFNFYLTTYAVVGIFPVLLGAGLYRCCQGYTPAWVYCAGWLVFGILAILYALFTQGILPADSIASHGIYMGAVWESILFSLALGYRISPLTMLGHCGAQYQALARMCATFNKTMGDALIEIDGRLGEKGDLDLAELASLIHRIRGSCATIGATVLAEELQKFAACDNRATAQRQYALTVDTFYNTRRALHALLATLRTT